jgi:hypothetical protein
MDRNEKEGSDLRKQQQQEDGTRSTPADGAPEKNGGGDKLDLDIERKPRTCEEMAAEAAELRKLFV